ncbi:hypothetical protein SNOG_11862 [Parastagonospora nodorum SN15]|uniref:Uncharacterized protein n=1 Tax=Phaeosphaeria nodorum (strain SN15 / ATCC MYA-4574 / FGSC 10173) TaxID=321614 RepID=Q0U8Q2_PHANO|nr:hypothetical protein SNOG_11862 [Parastagonospora nodorum SN15]EAT80906.1 hypothetical protein SNOG_11862 [Parastagonospora nodorum SN15]
MPFDSLQADVFATLAEVFQPANNFSPAGKLMDPGDDPTTAPRRR